ncbi:Putative type I restriction enzyme (hsdR-like) (fragment) [Frankia alni ACN14a]|uniref:Type I restriction enzyme (HsdR-like) n=1 Tax=Frankia alni (strain DSM 45986 / CECT 9034 / ACN14a) TaxID=326424 RepID=Q0RQY7_FRAAA
MTGTGVIDIFAEAGLGKPGVSVIDGEFRKRFETSDRQHLQLEAVRRLIANEVRLISRRNIAAGRKFSESSTTRSTGTRTGRLSRPR